MSAARPLAELGVASPPAAVVPSAPPPTDLAAHLEPTSIPPQRPSRAGRATAFALVGLGVLGAFGVVAVLGAQWWTSRPTTTVGEVGGGVPMPPPTTDSTPTVEAEAPPAVEAEAAPVVEPEAEPVPEPEVAPVAEPAVEPEAAPVVEPEAAPVVEPEAAPVAEGSDPAELVRQAEAADTDAAREVLYRRALQLDPRNHYAMIGLAEVLLRRDQPSQAIPLIEGAIRRRGRRAAYRVMLGDARQRAGDLEGAREAWRAALEIDPDDAAARARLGE